MKFSPITSELNLTGFLAEENIITIDEASIMKGKKVPIGTITNGYKKVAEGKWQKVSSYGLTKKEHQAKQNEYLDGIYSAQQKNDDAELRHNDEKEKMHGKAAKDLDDKEYDDAHVDSQSTSKLLDANKNREPRHGYISDEDWKDDDSRKFEEEDARVEGAGNELQGKKGKLETSIRDAEAKAKELRGKGNRMGAETYENLAKQKRAELEKLETAGSGKKSEKDQRLSLIEKLINQGFSPEDAKKQVDGDKVTDEQRATIQRRIRAKLDERDEEYKNKKIEKSYVLGEYDHDEIQKSHITEMFGYGQNQIQISKTGKEIKSALQSIKTKEEAEKSKYLTQYTTILAQIGCEPTEDVDDYIIDGFSDKIGDIPKTFPWGECYNDSSNLSTFSNLQEKESATNISNLKDQYNRSVRKYIDCCKEIVQIDTMINNLEDSKKFSLTVKQATILGF